MKKPCSSDNLNGAAGGHAIALLGIAVSDPESTLGGKSWRGVTFLEIGMKTVGERGWIVPYGKVNYGWEETTEKECVDTVNCEFNS